MEETKPSSIIDNVGDLDVSGVHKHKGTPGASGTIDLTTITSIRVEGGIITGWS